MKEGVLGFFLACKLMYIIDDQYVNHLVEMQEVILVIVPDGIHKLRLELVGIHIEDRLVREELLYFYSNGLCQVGFSQPAVSIDQKGVKCCATWILRHGKSCRSCQPVAFSFNKVLK